MILTRTLDVRANLKKYFDLAYAGDPVIVSRKRNENVAIISERELNEFMEYKEQKRREAYEKLLQKAEKVG